MDFHDLAQAYHAEIDTASGITDPTLLLAALDEIQKRYAAMLRPGMHLTENHAARLRLKARKELKWQIPH